MDFYDINYRNHIRNYIENQKKKNREYSYKTFAANINVQKPYLSKVLGAQANLNSDQIYLACQEMQLNPEEKQFMYLLWEMERTGLEKRKQEIIQDISDFQKLKEQTEQHIDIKKAEVKEEFLHLYYTNPINQIIHIALGLDRFQNNYQEIASALNISKDQLQDSLKTLEKIGLIEWKDKITLRQRKIHLPRQSPVFWAWKTQLSLLSLQRCRQLNDTDQSYNFSVVFSCNENTRKEIQKNYFEFLKKVEKLVTECESKENVYQLNYDLFPWTGA